MCGIAGYFSHGQPFPIRNEDGFHQCLKLRGPDHNASSAIQGKVLNGKLFHYRLAIIDLEARSNQPMKSNSGHSEIVFNGEIYNFQELRSELSKEGYTFNTKSDTEVLLTGYEHWGISTLVQKLDGMFSFVIYDSRNDEIAIGRDPFGKKPLYYYLDDTGRFAFSSDVRSFEHLGLSLTIDPVALSYYFCELSTPERHSIYSEIRKFPAGHFGTLKQGKLEIDSYWKIDYSQKIKLSRPEILEESERLIEQAVKKRLISDVGVSAFLSGGIDSSLIVAMMAKNSGNAVKTYTIGYKNKAFDESEYAEKVAKKYNTSHSTIYLDEINPELVKFVLDECGEPFADSSILPSYIICNAIAKHERVALSGDGGDEVFGGYYEYYFASRLDKYKGQVPLMKLLRGLKKMGINHSKTTFAAELMERGFDLPEPELLHRRGMGFTPDEVSKLMNPAYFRNPMLEFERIWNENKGNAQTILDKVMSCSLHTRLVNDYLPKVDRASMMNSLEVRSPFLDKDLIQFTSQIPGEQLIYNGIPKSITKEIAQKYLPEEDIYRQKMGFGVPIGDWFRTELKSNVEVMRNEDLGQLNAGYKNEVIDAHLSGKKLDSKMVSLFAFNQWNKSFDGE